MKNVIRVKMVRGIYRIIAGRQILKDGFKTFESAVEYMDAHTISNLLGY